MKNKLAQESLKAIGVAFKQFGEYSFFDKGPQEVMDVGSLVEKYRTLSAEEAGAAILELAQSEKHKGAGEILASSLLCDMQDWDELFEIPGVGDYL